MIRLQLSVPDEIAIDWRHRARAAGMPIGAYIRLKMGEDAWDKSAEESQQLHGSIGPRLLAAMVASGHSSITKRALTGLSTRLGVGGASILAAANSLCATPHAKLRYDKATRVYHRLNTGDAK